MARRGRRLGEGLAEGRRDAEHLAGRAHFGPQQRVDLGEAIRREDRHLHEDAALGQMRVAAAFFFRARDRALRSFEGLEVARLDHRRERFAQDQSRGDANERQADRLRHPRHGAARARIRLDDVDHAVLDRELHVEEADHAEGARQARGDSAQRALVACRHLERRQHRGGIARVDARFLDVLLHTRDEDVASVGERIDVDLEGVFQEAIDVERAAGKPTTPGESERLARVTRKRFSVVDHLHRATAEDVRRADDQRIAHALGHRDRARDRARARLLRMPDVESIEQRGEALAILRQIDRVDRGAEDAHAGGLERAREVERRLPAELHDHPLGLLALDHVKHVLERDRLEIESIGGVVVGRDRLRIAIQQYRLDARVLDREGGVARAVVELDPLADADGTAAQDQHLPIRGRLGLAARLVGRVEVGRVRLELAGAGVDAMVDRPDAEPLPRRAQLAFVGPHELGEASIGEADALRPTQDLLRQRGEGVAFDPPLGVGDLAHLAEEPRLDAGPRGDLLHREAMVRPAAQRFAQSIDALGRGDLDPRKERRVVERFDLAAPAPARGRHLERTKPLAERLLEGAADRHHLTDRLHLRAERRDRAGKLLEIPARDLDHDVVERRLERRRRLLRDVVQDLVQPIPDREARRDLRDGEAGRLGGERRGARHARVHLDHDHAACRRMDRELDVRAAGFDPDSADDREGLITKVLVLAIGQRHRGRDRDRIAGVDAHRIEVLDRADDHALVGVVAHHLELVLLPAEHRLLDQKLPHRRELEPALDDRDQLLARARDAAAHPAERERRAHHHRIAEALRKVVMRSLGQRARGGERRGDATSRDVEADLDHRVLEALAILGQLERVEPGAQELHAMLLQQAALGQRDREVDRGLSAHRRQDRVGLLALQDLAQAFDRERLDVGAVFTVRGARRIGQEIRIGHDRRRIRVHQDDAIALGRQRLHRLRARVVELACLPDHDRTRAENQNALDARIARHAKPPAPRARTDRRSRPRRAVRAPPRDGTARSRAEGSGASPLRPCRRSDSDA